MASLFCWYYKLTAGEQERFEALNAQLKADKALLEDRRKLTQLREESLGNSTELQQILEQESQAVEQARLAAQDDRNKLALREQEFAAFTNSIEEQRLDLEARESELNVKQEQFDMQWKSLEEARDAHVAQTQAAAAEQGRLDTLQAHLTTLESNLNQKEQSLKEMQQRVSREQEELIESRNALKLERTELLSKSQSVADELSRIEVTKEALLARINELEITKAAIEAKSERAERQIAEAQSMSPTNYDATLMRLQDDLKIEEARLSQERADFEKSVAAFNKSRETLAMEHEKSARDLEKKRQELNAEIFAYNQSKELLERKTNLKSDTDESVKEIAQLRSQIETLQFALSSKDTEHKAVVRGFDHSDHVSVAIHEVLKTTLDSILQRLSGIELNNAELTKDVGRLSKLIETPLIPMSKPSETM
jgi:chromosome segregation ATPase